MFFAFLTDVNNFSGLKCDDFKDLKNQLLFKKFMPTNKKNNIVKKVDTISLF